MKVYLNEAIEENIIQNADLTFNEWCLLIHVMIYLGQMEDSDNE